MSNYSFSTDGVNYTIVNDNNTIVKNLPVGVYNMREEKIGIYLEHIGDKFTFSFERFGFDDEFINYVVKRYEKLNRNMGVLLNGTKGCGKTCTAKALANELKLPIIIVSEIFDNIGEFIQKMGNSCCFFFDEFDKTCDKQYYGSSTSDDILPIFDGVRSGDVKHVFILTTNRLEINENLISRPGRILYRKSYDSLSLDSISKYVQKYLVKKEYFDEMMEEIGRMSIKSIDTIKTLIDEVNDMDVAPHVAMGFLNINVVSYEIKCCMEIRPNLARHDDFCLSDFLGGKPYEFSSGLPYETFETEKNPKQLTIGDKLDKYVIKDIYEGHYLLEDITNKLAYICVVEDTRVIDKFVSTNLKVDPNGNIVRYSEGNDDMPF